MQTPLQFQIPLPIHQVDHDTLNNFYPGENTLLLNSLQRNITHLEQPFFFIWGKISSGKSHLLKAVSNEFLCRQACAVYVPLSKSCYFSPEVLDNLEFQQAICLDDLQEVVGDAQWELAIFDLINRIKEQGNSLLIASANLPPSQLPIQLPDLKSRLMWGEIYQLIELSDVQKARALQKEATRRGFELSEETANFLLHRLDRNMQSLFNAFNLLDKASLQAKRNKLTIPFVKEVLHL